MGFKDYREQSKKKWGTENEKIEIEQIKLGATLRIADAVEKMTINYTSMENNLKWYKGKYDEKNKEIQRLGRVIAGLRGHLTRIKNKTNNK